MPKELFHVRLELWTDEDPTQQPLEALLTKGKLVSRVHYSSTNGLPPVAGGEKGALALLDYFGIPHPPPKPPAHHFHPGDYQVRYLLEKRTPTYGLLDFSDPQPPPPPAPRDPKDRPGWTADTLAQLYFRLSKSTAESASWDDILAFFETRHWYIRPITW